jgi:tRNA(Ile)-lysidine synthase
MLHAAVQEFLLTAGIERPRILAACSGGVDSTALLIVLAETEGVTLTAAHVNHHLRGAESEGDEVFVRDLCARLGVPLLVADGSLDPAEVRRLGVEAAAREVRLTRVQEMRQRAGAAFIATAHQRNDQAETVLMRLMTGSGIAGLRGIHPIREDGIIRPLLDVSRSDIEAFLRDREIVPRLDSSNADPRFLRTHVRAMLAGVGEDAVRNIAAVAAHAREQWRVLERVVDAAEQAIVTENETRFTAMPDDPWLRQALLHRHIRRLSEHVRDVSATDLGRLANQLDAIRRVSVTKDVELLRRGDEVILRRKPEKCADFEIEFEREAWIPELQATIHVQRSTRHAAPGTQHFQLPAGATPRFVVRNRRPGDRFRPLGLPHEKKLKDLLIDRKIPAEGRDRIPLLVWNGCIVWVAGVEISDSFKVTGGAGERYEVWLEVEDREGVQR